MPPRKRKLSSATKSTNTEEPPQKQQQVEQQDSQTVVAEQQEEEQLQQEAQAGTEPETQHNEEENGDPDEEYEEVEEEDSEENEDDPDENQPQNAQSLKEENDDGDDPVEKLLELFSKDQLIEILREAAESYPDVAEKIRKVADEDPAHRKVFVHGLGWDTTAESLTNEFKKYGEIEDVKNVVDKMSGKCKGYAFILFKTRKGARCALKEPQKKISNRVASCQLAVVGPTAPQQNVAAAQQAAPEFEHTKKKIYVSNVGAELDPQKLLEFFRKYGEIEDGPLGLDKATGKPKGFCLFVYKTAESARKALEEPHKNFEGNILHCQKAIDGPKPGKGKFQQPFQQQNPQSTQFQRKKNQGFAGGSSTGQGHLMAPSGPGMMYNQGPAAAQALNPALGQALTALLSNPAANLGLTNLLGTLGSTAGVNPGMPGAPPPMQGGYGNQGMHGGYGNQSMGPGGAGRGQHGGGHYGGGH